MADRIRFGRSEGVPQRSPLCVACEEMVADYVDEVLSDADKAWVKQHIGSCAECSQALADAQRGAAWLELLKTPRPEPSSALLERILAQTSEGDAPVVLAPQGLPALSPQVHDAWRPAVGRAKRLQFPAWISRTRHFEPRLAMTAAMAFFSIALTLNLAGIRLDQLHARDLNPTHVKQTYYEASAEAVRYYDNLRVVRVLESRVDDLRATNGDDVEPKQPETQPATQQSTPEPHPVSPEPKQSAPGSHPADAPKKGSGGVSVARPPMEQLRLLPVTWHGRMLRVSGGAA